MRINLEINWQGGYGSAYKILTKGEIKYVVFVDKKIFILDEENIEEYELNLSELKTFYKSNSGLSFNGLFEIEVNNIIAIKELPFYRNDYQNIEIFCDNEFVVYNRKNNIVKVFNKNNLTFNKDMLILVKDNHKFLPDTINYTKIKKLLLIECGPLTPKEFIPISKTFKRIDNEKYVKIGNIWFSIDDLKSAFKNDYDFIKNYCINFRNI